MEQFLQETLNSIRKPDRDAMAQALARQESLAKPPHSLGKLEDISVKLAGMTGRLYNPVDRSPYPTPPASCYDVGGKTF